MSDRICGFTVVFEDSVSDEYMERIKNAIGLMENTATVTPIVEDTSTFIGQSQENYRIKNVIFDLIKTNFNLKK